MRHARKDYNRFQDPEGKIPEDEPVFLLRGQDMAAPQTVEFWALLAENYGASPEHVALAREWAWEMRHWQEQHGNKVPDLPYLEYRRADGGAICQRCGQEYRRHPVAPEHLDYLDQPWLNRLCDGSLVKL